MERIKLRLTEDFKFSTLIPIRITDLNYGGHVGNDVFLSLVHEARLQFLQSFGYKELDFAGVGLIMVDAGIEYKRELHYGDIVKISVAATGFDKLGFDIQYILEIQHGDQVTLAGKAKTGMLCYDYQLKMKVPVPEAALHNLQPPVH